MNKKYKLITIQKDGQGSWQLSEGMLNTYIENGWVVEHVSPIPGSNGSILVMLSMIERI